MDSVVWDIFLFFASYIRAIGFIIYFDKAKYFMDFILLSVKRFFFYLIIFVIIFISIGVLFYNLNTEKIKDSKDFTGTILNLFLFCHGK